MASSAYTAASQLGNNIGYIYQMDHLGTTVVSSYDNNREGVRAVKSIVDIDVPLSAGTKAFNSTQITAVTGTGNVTAIAVNRGGISVNQLGANVPFVPATTPTELVSLLATEINSTSPAAGLNYTAEAIGDTLKMFAENGAGVLANGDILSWTVTESGDEDVAVTKTPTAAVSGGGFEPGANFAYNRYYIDTTGNGTVSTPSVGSVEITEVIVPKSAQSGIPTQSLAIASNVATYDRKGRISYVRITTEGAIASDDLVTIATEGISDGDLVVIMRDTAGQTITIRSTGNLNLTGAPTDFVIDADNKSIWFIYRSSASVWEEIFRTSVEDITDAGLRTSGISVGKSGSSIITILPAGGTTTVSPGVTAKNIVWDGNGVTLAGSAVLTQGGAPIDGDPFYVHYLPVGNTGGNTVTIFGNTLSDSQATGGALAFAFYDTANLVWRSKIAVDGATNYVTNSKIPNAEITAAKLANTGVVAGSYTFSNLTVNAQGLITTATSGIGASGGVLHSIVSSIGTAANTAATDLHTYTMPAQTMITNGDIIIIKCMFTTAANANAKTMSLYFGSTVLATITGTLNAQDLVMESTITRYATANQLSITTNYYTTTGGGTITTEAYDDDSMTEDLDSDVIIKTLGTNGVATLNDIVSKTLMVTLFKR